MPGDTTTAPDVIGLREVANRHGTPLDTLRRFAAEAAARGLLTRVGHTWVCEAGRASELAEFARRARRATGK